MRYLRQNTATIVTIGPFLDKTDGVTLEDAIAEGADEKITFIIDANDGSAPTKALDMVATNASADNDVTDLGTSGYYGLELTAANTNYVGRAVLSITNAAVHCPVFHEFTLLPANVYDSMVAGTDSLEVDATALSGDATAANNAEAFFDGTGYAGTNNVIPLVTVATTATNLTNLPAAAATAAELAKVPKSDSNVSWNATALAAINAEVDTALNTAIPVGPTADSINERIVAIDAFGAPPTAASISDAVWDEAIADHAGAGSTGLALAGATAPSAASVADAVLDEASAGHAGFLTTLSTAAELAKVPKSDSNVTFNATALASVNAEVADVVNTDAQAELAAVPAANASLSAKVNWLFLLARNKRLTTAAADIVRDDANTVDVGTAALSDDGTTFTRGEYA